MDAEIIHNNEMIETRLHRNKTKLPTPWTSNFFKRYKRNIIKAELYRAKHISSNFTNEVALIRNKFKLTGYPMQLTRKIRAFHVTTFP